MRLSPEYVSVIKNSILEYIPEAEIFLYGSRTDDSKKGGDIDLLVKVQQEPERIIKSQIKTQIFNKIGEQKIDIIYKCPEKNSSFIELIELEAIPL
ncbi:MAG: nucleotidyltransferase domain-containing protein [Candidatus Caenarcaniphilales bacterium]|nr:nucleotidyltransferase domain-containing protein [Candidatus Caenarcaniphilales bacterium]